MELVHFNCPSCGAELPPSSPTGAQRCEYCGSRFAPNEAKAAKTAAGAALDKKALIEHLRLLQARVAQQEAEAKTRASESKREARRERKAKSKSESKSKPLLGRLFGAFWKLLMLAIPLAAIVASLVASGVLELADLPLIRDFEFAEHIHDELSSEGIDPWAGPAMIAEVDGHPAALVRVLDHRSGHMFVDAYSLPEGERQWRIGPLNDRDRDLEHVRFTVAGPYVVVSGADSTLFIHSIDSGARIRSADLRDPVDYLCTLPASEPGVAPKVYVRGSKRRHELLDPETGELSRQRSELLGCERARAEDLDPGVHPLTSVRNKLGMRELELQRVQLVAEAGRGVVLALGKQAPALVVALGFEFELEEAQVRARRVARGRERMVQLNEPAWRFELPEGATLGPSALAPAGSGEAEGGTSGRIFVAWRDAEGASHLSGLSLDTGELAWTAVVELGPGERVVSLRADADHLLVARTHVLELRDAGSGSLHRTIGESP